jgi:hypothetical protein
VENFSAPTLEQEVSYEQQVGLQNQARVQDFISRRDKQTTAEDARTQRLQDAITTAVNAATTAVNAAATTITNANDASVQAQTAALQNGFDQQEARTIAREVKRRIVMMEAVDAARKGQLQAVTKMLSPTDASKMAFNNALQVARREGYKGDEARAIAADAARETNQEYRSKDDNYILVGKFNDLIKSIKEQRKAGDDRINAQTAAIIQEIQKSLDKVSAPARTASGQLENEVKYEGTNLSNVKSVIERGFRSRVIAPKDLKTLIHGQKMIIVPIQLSKQKFKISNSDVKKP